jgi:sulfate-transporting ATPase
MSDEKIIFSMAGISKIYPPKKQVLKDIYLSFFYGAKIGVLGLNGSGKSTLLRIIAGKDTEYQGEIAFSPGYTVGMFEQEPHIDPEKTVREVVEEGVGETVRLLKEFEDINLRFSEESVMNDPDKMDKLIQKQAEVQEKLDNLNAWELDSRLERAMDALNCPPQEALIEHLSGGEKRRVALCRLLLEEPDVLLLDEPTNHLDAESVHWLEQHLKQYKGTVIAVTHDRYFLDNVAGWILELDRGEGIPWKGNYSSWLEQKENRLSQEEKSESKRQKTLQRELEWIRMSPKAKHAKSKSRINAYEKLLDQDSKEKIDKLELYIPSGPRLGTKVIDAKNVSKAYGDKLLFEDLSFSLPQGGIVGVIGPNGAGKTTLFKLITGNEKPDSGTFDVGPTVEIAYLDQEHQSLDPGKNVWETISEGNELIMLGGKEINSRAYVSKFNFNGTDEI